MVSPTNELIAMSDEIIEVNGEEVQAEDIIAVADELLEENENGYTTTHLSSPYIASAGDLVAADDGDRDDFVYMQVDNVRLGRKSLDTLHDKAENALGGEEVIETVEQVDLATANEIREPDFFDTKPTVNVEVFYDGGMGHNGYFSANEVRKVHEAEDVSLVRIEATDDSGIVMGLDVDE